MLENEAILNINEVHMPVASHGVCLNWKRCHSFQVDLGDGYCVDCYDRGLEKRGRVLKSLETEYENVWR